MTTFLQFSPCMDESFSRNLRHFSHRYYSLCVVQITTFLCSFAQTPDIGVFDHRGRTCRLLVLIGVQLCLAWGEGRKLRWKLKRLSLRAALAGAVQQPDADISSRCYTELFSFFKRSRHTNHAFGMQPCTLGGSCNISRWGNGEKSISPIVRKVIHNFLIF